MAMNCNTQRSINRIIILTMLKFVKVCGRMTTLINHHDDELLKACHKNYP